MSGQNFKVRTQADLLTAVCASYDFCRGARADSDIVAAICQGAIDRVLEDRDEMASRERNRFDGAYYNPARDDQRLENQLQRVFNVMRDGQWHTVPEICAETGDPAMSVGAQLCHLRKAKHGNWIVDTENISGETGLYHRRLRNPDGTSIADIGLRPEAFDTRGSNPSESTEL